VDCSTDFPLWCFSSGVSDGLMGKNTTKFEKTPENPIEKQSTKLEGKATNQ
jgi:hypothetical protein